MNGPTREVECTECHATTTIPAQAIHPATAAVDLHTYVIEQNIRCDNDGAQSWRLTGH